MKLILKSFQSDAVFTVRPQDGQDTPIQQNYPDGKHQVTQSFLKIPSGCCMTGNPVNPYRMSVCQLAGECIQNRRLSAPTGDADFFA